MHHCQQCGREITVFVGEPRGFDWSYQPFCDQCKAALDTGAGCPACQTGYAEFLASGFLGCQTCYTAHAGRLVPLLRSTRNPRGNAEPAGPPPVITLDSLARSRTEEVRSYVLETTGADHPSVTTVPGLHWENGIGIAPPPGEQSELSPDGDRTGQGVIQSVRLRWARNLHRIPYWPALDRGQRSRLAAALVAPGAVLAQQRRESGPDDLLGRATFRIGDEDHLRIEWRLLFQEDDRLVKRQCDALANTLQRLDRLYMWQFHRDFGALTACPANCGSGVRLSFLVRIPRVLASGEWKRWREELEAAGLVIRGPGGEGTRPGKSGVLQISNRHWPADTHLSTATLRIFAILGSLARRESAGAA